MVAARGIFRLLVVGPGEALSPSLPRDSTLFVPVPVLLVASFSPVDHTRLQI